MLASIHHRIERIELKWRLLFVIVMQVGYMTASRIIGANVISFAQAELYRTPYRILLAVLFWFAMRDVIMSHAAKLCAMKSSWFAIALTLLFATPILVGGHILPSDENLILAILSISVGFAEEPFFRGIIQNVCVKRWGIARGLTITAVLFTAFHIGVTSHDFMNLAGIFLISLIFGLIYLTTGSLLVVIGIHAILDALYSVPVYFYWQGPLWGFIAIIGAALYVAHWFSVEKNRQSFM